MKKQGLFFLFLLIALTTSTLVAWGIGKQLTSNQNQFSRVDSETSTVSVEESTFNTSDSSSKPSKLIGYNRVTASDEELTKFILVLFYTGIKRTDIARVLSVASNEGIEFIRKLSENPNLFPTEFRNKRLCSEMTGVLESVVVDSTLSDSDYRQEFRRKVGNAIKQSLENLKAARGNRPKLPESIYMNNSVSKEKLKQWLEFFDIRQGDKSHPSKEISKQDVAELSLKWRWGIRKNALEHESPNPPELDKVSYPFNERDLRKIRNSYGRKSFPLFGPLSANAAQIVTRQRSKSGGKGANKVEGESESPATKDLSKAQAKSRYILGSQPKSLRKKQSTVQLKKKPRIAVTRESIAKQTVKIDTDVQKSDTKHPNSSQDQKQMEPLDSTQILLSFHSKLAYQNDGCQNQRDVEIPDQVENPIMSYLVHSSLKARYYGEYPWFNKMRNKDNDKQQDYTEYSRSTNLSVFALFQKEVSGISGHSSADTGAVEKDSIPPFDSMSSPELWDIDRKKAAGFSYLNGRNLSLLLELIGNTTIDSYEQAQAYIKQPGMMLEDYRSQITAARYATEHAIWSLYNRRLGMIRDWSQQEAQRRLLQFALGKDIYLEVDSLSTQKMNELIINIDGQTIVVGHDLKAFDLVDEAPKGFILDSDSNRLIPDDRIYGDDNQVIYNVVLHRDKVPVHIELNAGLMVHQNSDYLHMEMLPSLQADLAVGASSITNAILLNKQLDSTDFQVRKVLIQGMKQLQTPVKKVLQAPSTHLHNYHLPHPSIHQGSSPLQLNHQLYLNNLNGFQLSQFSVFLIPG